MKRNTISLLYGYLKPHMAMLAVSVLCAILSVAATLTVPVMIGGAVDRIITAGNVNFAALPPYIFAIAAFAAFAAIFQWLSAFLSNKVTSRTMRDLRVRLFDALSTASLNYIDTTAQGGIINAATNDIEQVCDGLTAALTQLFTGAATVAGTLVFMLAVNPSVAAVVILLTPLSLLVAAVIARGSHKYFVAQTIEQGKLNSCADELIGCRETLSAYNYRDTANTRFAEINGRLAVCGFKSQLYSAMANPSTRFVNAMVYAAAGVIGALSAVGGGMSVGEISTFLIYAGQYTKPFNEISGVVAQFQSAIASAERVFEVISAQPEYEPSNPIPLPDTDGSVLFDNVGFSYIPQRPLIKNLSLIIPPSSRIAIVGPTGSGKTTLINLLMRFYSPQKGKICLGNTDIANLSSGELRSRFGMVLQDTQLFAGTVRYNIAYGMPDASEAEVEHAAKLASAHSFISRLPQGYNTVIGGSESLSHGQRQLICIARAVLSNPDIALLDEATSGIDVRTERMVQGAFAELMKGRTSFVVAHRLDTIKNSDLILVMDNGDIAERGTHQELLANGGLYAHLYAAMSS